MSSVLARFVSIRTTALLVAGLLTVLGAFTTFASPPSSAAAAVAAPAAASDTIGAPSATTIVAESATLLTKRATTTSANPALVLTDSSFVTLMPSDNPYNFNHPSKCYGAKESRNHYSHGRLASITNKYWRSYNGGTVCVTEHKVLANGIRTYVSLMICRDSYAENHLCFEDACSCKQMAGPLQYSHAGIKRKIEIRARNTWKGGSINPHYITNAK